MRGKEKKEKRKEEGEGEKGREGRRAEEERTPCQGHSLKLEAQELELHACARLSYLRLLGEREREREREARHGHRQDGKLQPSTEDGQYE